MSWFNASPALDADPVRAAQLRRWIIVIGVLTLAVFVASSAYDAWRLYRHSVNDTRRSLDSVAKALAQQAQGSLQLIDLLLRETKAWYAVERTSPDGSLNDTLARRVAGLPHVRLVAIADRNGKTRFHSRDITPVIDDVSDRPYFIAQRDRPQPGVFLSEPIVTSVEHRPAVVLSRRLDTPEGAFDGIVWAVIDLDEFQNLYRAIDLGAGSSINLMRDDGMLMVREPPIGNARGRVVSELIGATAALDGLVSSPIDRVPRFVGVARVPGFPLVAAVTRDQSVALLGWREEAYHVAFRTLVLVTLGALAIVALVRQLRRIELGERALRASEERYALAMEGANEGHWDWNLADGPSYLSPTMKVLHGRPIDAPVTNRERWMAEVEVHPDDQARVEAAARDHFAGRTDRYELEYRVRHPDGRWHWLLARGRCMRDGSNNVHRFLGSAIDITARRQAEDEKQRLEQQLRQAQKLEAMGTLAGGIAHDFNNILGAILGYGEMAQKKLTEGSAERRYLDNVMHAGGRAKALVERILAFSRSGVGNRVPVDVQSVVVETLELLRASLPAGMRLVAKLDADGAAIIGDSTQLHQVVMNLCTNAIHAMPDGGVIEVSLERARLPAPKRLTHGTAMAGAHVRLAVRDTGTGIAPALVDRIFDPFFTTKGVGEGTGLGLALVHGIVSDLGGAIDVSTGSDEGALFTIWLPLHDGTVEPRRNDDAAPPAGRGQVVLVVDDERALVALAEETLAELGYEPVGFASSLAALAAFRAAPDRFDAVLTDETMPELSGTDLIRLIRENRPEIPAVLMSGYAGPRLLERARDASVTSILRKPLQRRDLADCFARVFAAPEAAAPSTLSSVTDARAPVIEEQP